MHVLNHGLQWDQWVLTNLSHSIDCGLTHLFLGRTSHAWLHTRGVRIRMAALRLYHARRNVKDRDYEYDRGIRCIILQCKLPYGPFTLIKIRCASYAACTFIICSILLLLLLLLLLSSLLRNKQNWRSRSQLIKSLSVLEVFVNMSYINSRFTYLLLRVESVLCRLRLQLLTSKKK